RCVHRRARRFIEFFRPSKAPAAALAVRLITAMGTLDYQKPDDAAREIRAGWRHKIFGLSKADVWTALANEINARHESGGWWKGDRVVAAIASWQITLDT